MRRLLGLRDARLYLAGQTLSLLGDTALWLAMGVWVKSLTGSSGAAALVFLAFALPQLLSPVAGVLVDRVRRRRLLLVTNLLTAAAVLPLLLVDGPGDVWIVYGVMVLYGASYAVLGAGQSALLTVLLPDALLGAGNAALQTLREGLRLVGPLAGAALFAWLGGAAVALLDAATFLAAAGALALMRVAEPVPVRRRRDWRRELTDGLRHLGASPGLRRLAGAGALAVVGFGLSEAVVFAVVDEGLGRPPGFVGVLLAVQGVGAIVAGLAAPRVMARAGEGGLCALGMALAAGGIPLLAVSALPVVVTGVLLFGASLPWIVVGALTLLQRSTPAPLQGRAYGAFELSLALPQTLAIGAGAVLVEAIDHRLLLAAMAVLEGLAAGWLVAGARLRAPGRPRIGRAQPAVGTSAPSSYHE